MITVGNAAGQSCAGTQQGRSYKAKDEKTRTADILGETLKKQTIPSNQARLTFTDTSIHPSDSLIVTMPLGDDDSLSASS